MTIEKEIIKEIDFIEISLRESNVFVRIKYPKKSTLEKRFKLLDKLKEAMRRI
jgi:hypothetical protein